MIVIFIHIYCRVHGRTSWMQALFCRELMIHHSARRMRLKLLTPTSTYRQFNNRLHFLIGRNFIPSKILSSNNISCNFIFNANWIFKSLTFYRSHPSAGNKQSIHIVSFPAGCMRSRPAGSWLCIFFINLNIIIQLTDIKVIYTGWPRKNATTLIVNFMNIVDETELFCISFGRTFIFQQNDTMIINFG